MRQRAFTLIELLVAIVIIGILAALVLGALAKANTSAKVLKTQATIAKLHQQIMTKWESYKFKRLPVDPKMILLGGNANVNTFIAKMYANTNIPALNVASGSANFPTPPQIAACRLLAVRELQRYEMPTGWEDILATNTSTGALMGSPGNWQMRTPLVLLNAPQLAQAYVQRINAARDINGNPPSEAQLKLYDAAECLYLIVKLACEDENNSLADSVKEVGDADGDGLLEFQDAFAGMDQSYPTNAAAFGPIMWNRWPAGFCNHNQSNASGAYTSAQHFSNFQDDPVNMIAEQSNGGLQVVADALIFSRDNHDYFDPLKLDIPASGATTGRGFQLTPLIYSAGPDNKYGLFSPLAWNDVGLTTAQQNAGINDPYSSDSGGQQNAQWHNGSFIPATGVEDIITNHNLGSGR